VSVKPPILGLHHVTATVDVAQADLDFCIETLGLRLVKKTVNFDNHHVYHFYYGNEHGTPGTIWTTFPYKGHGVRIGTKGAGQVTATAFSVPPGSLKWWKKRLHDRGTATEDLESRFGEESLHFSDPTGLALQLVANDGDARAPWTGSGIDANQAIRGLHSVTLTVHSAVKTIELMTKLLGFEVMNASAGHTQVAVNGHDPGHSIVVIEDPGAVPALNGIGTVHHVAMAIADADSQLRLRQALIRFGCKVTEVRDRQYFQSIYFREPGGVLFEVATVQPGFTFDEPLPCLGQDLKLPPWEEPNRPEIEGALARVNYRLPSC